MKRYKNQNIPMLEVVFLDESYLVCQNCKNMKAMCMCSKCIASESDRSELVRAVYKDRSMIVHHMTWREIMIENR